MEDARDRVGPGTAAQGEAQVELLAAAARHALERAGLTDLIEELERRVLGRPTQETCDIVQMEGGGTHVAFKPMIELLLLEVKHVARAPHITDVHRRERIRLAMTLAGV